MKDNEEQRHAKKGDTIIVTREGGNGTTKGKGYEVTHICSGMGGEAVTFQDDDNKQRTVNVFWWDFPIEETKTK